MSLSTRSKVVVGVSIGLFFCSIFYLSKARKARHLSAYQNSVSFAKISFESVSENIKSSPTIYFTFLANGVKYSGNGPGPRNFSRRRLLKMLDQGVFVVYSPQDPTVYDILMTKSDLLNYKIAYPDSVLSSVNSIEDIIDGNYPAFLGIGKSTTAFIAS